MGVFVTGGPEQAQSVISGTLGALNAASAQLALLGNFNVAQDTLGLGLVRRLAGEADEEA